MFLAFVIIIIITWIAILYSIYSIFNPFVTNFSDIVDYNIAYYWAIAWIERGELVLKFRWPGFQWSGWWLDNNYFWKNSDLISDSFAIITWDKQWILWDINSRTNRIPKEWYWNVDISLSALDSIDYNKLDYNNIENFILSIDESWSGFYYTWGGNYRENYSGTVISGVFRLAPKIFSWFNSSPLCDDSSYAECDPDWDNLYNDFIVNRSLKWYKNWEQFSIMPNESVYYYWVQKAVQDWDTLIRESNINASSGIVFGNSKNIFNPSSTSPEKQNVISNESSIASDNFGSIFSFSSYTWLQLRFWLVNLLSSMSGNIYPFLEYYFGFDNEVSDRFFDIKWNGRKWNYDVKILIKKPTFEETIGGSFTIIF